MTIMQWFLFFLIIQVIHFLGTWKLYVKAGRKSWEAIVPVYNAVILMKIINRPKWWVILLFIPIINLLMFPILWIETIRSFGKNSKLDTTLALVTFGLYTYYVNYFTDAEYIEDRSLQPNSGLGDWVSSIAFAIIAATLVHTYVMRPFTIPTSSLEKSLLVGDFLFVSKFHYGARIPMTAIALPMVHDSMPSITIPFTGLKTPSFKSYSGKPQLPYLRLPGIQKIKRNEIVVFNWPADSLKWMWNDRSGKFTDKPIDKKTNYVKRCVAIAGDTLQIIDGDIYINGEISIMPDRAKSQYNYVYETNKPFSIRDLPKELEFNEQKYVYKISKEYWGDSRVQQAFEESASLVKVSEDSLFVDVAGQIYSNLANRLNMTIVSNKRALNLTSEEYEKLKSLPNTISLEKMIYQPSLSIFPHSKLHPWSIDNYGPLYIPKKGATIEINSKTIPIYEHLIREYDRNDVTVEGDKMYINGQLATSYTFKQDYFWMMGDNRHNSLDARSYGFTPFDHVIGKAVFVWFSWETNGNGIKNKIRWDRLFTVIHGKGKAISYFYYFLGTLALWFGFSTYRKKKKG